ncbi:hemerythrin domain-containing protein [Streptomyces montanisoli]|uniref:Hemerythrin domain-containing protein n=1 Tax=Streptomyces montanisoli TaxID=2798581 RepID=A0A940RZ70_9ACTN|nr:hemerythrin domain-containing protein [Streptomyces montanisoli]MBP0459459.1 hemerythrin domain-containing protein [Streptomyces montanisoli]
MTSTNDRTLAARLPQCDIVALLLDQHATIKELFAQVESGQGDAKQEAFDQLRALLAVHEVGEELVVRPVAERTAGEKEAKARNEEEADATKVLKDLEKMDVSGPDFDRAIAQFKQAVTDHASHEEAEEFPALLENCTEEHRHVMGERLLKAEHLAPTHPHPTAAGKPAALAMTGPFASMMDRARDAMRG